MQKAGHTRRGVVDFPLHIVLNHDTDWPVTVIFGNPGAQFLNDIARDIQPDQVARNFAFRKQRPQRVDVMQQVYQFRHFWDPAGRNALSHHLRELTKGARSTYRDLTIRWKFCYQYVSGRI